MLNNFFLFFHSSYNSKIDGTHVLRRVESLKSVSWISIAPRGKYVHFSTTILCSFKKSNPQRKNISLIKLFWGFLESFFSCFHRGGKIEKWWQLFGYTQQHKEQTRCMINSNLAWVLDVIKNALKCTICSTFCFFLSQYWKQFCTTCFCRVFTKQRLKMISWKFSQCMRWHFLVENLARKATFRKKILWGFGVFFKTF